MKRIIRRATFETNSSSTHSLTMCMQSDYDKWYNGELLLAADTWGFEPRIEKLFVTKEEAINLLQTCYKYLPKDIDWGDGVMVDVVMHDAGFKWYEDRNEYLESYYGEFTTPSGETVVVFGEYGYDG